MQAILLHVQEHFKIKLKLFNMVSAAVGMETRVISILFKIHITMLIS